MSATINQLVCKNFVHRATALGYKGKARDRAGMDFLCGAISALQNNGQEEEANHLYMVTEMLIFPRGYSEIERLAKGDQTN